MMENKKIAIGIDIGGTNIEMAWINAKGDILKHTLFKTTNFEEPELLVETLCPIIIEENKKYDTDQIIGIGIGAPNGNYFNGTIEFAPNLKWKGVIPLSEMFEKHTGLKTILTNDANAAAYAEMQFGAAKEMEHFLVVTLGTGLGSGIVVDRKVLYGSTGFAGELGHTIAIENGRTCGCGRKGCLETYVSATGIVKTAKEMLEASKQISLLRHIENLDSKAIFQAAEQGDELAIKTLTYTANVLGHHLSDYISLFSPEAIFLTGGLAKAHKWLIPTIEESMNEHTLKIFRQTAKVYPSQLLDKNAGLLGAAAMLF
jgi:glucokinase